MKTPFCFYGHTRDVFYKAVLSNFHPTPSAVFVNGILIPTRTSEHAFMLKKAAHFSDWDIFNLMRESETPYEVKKLGKKVKGFSETEWDRVKFDYMIEAVTNKFNALSYKHQYQLRQFAEKHFFVECSPFDTVWGVGVSEADYLSMTEDEKKESW